jgi:hypothetical protein
MYRISLTVVFGCLVQLSAPVAGQHTFNTKLAHEPDDAEFVIDDVENFVRVQQLLADEGDKVGVLQKEYLDKGSVGLTTFVSKYDLTAERLAEAIGKNEEVYASLGKLPSWLASQQSSLRMAFTKFKRVIPHAVFPPTYFLVGSHRGIGSASAEGQLISIERFDPSEGKLLETMIVHELTHFQQAMAVGPDEYISLYGPKKNLLGLVIREGAAEFVADQVTGGITQHKARAYVLEHEKALWKRFEKEMHGSDTGDWMSVTPSKPDQPPMIGYMLGYRIVEAYYNGAEGKAAAIREILSTKDYPTFLAKSGYAEQFDN